MGGNYEKSVFYQLMEVIGKTVQTLFCHPPKTNLGKPRILTIVENLPRKRRAPTGA